MSASHSEPAHRRGASSDVPQIRVVFMGTSPFAATILSSIADAGYHLVAVYTQTDKPVGRKQELRPSAVKTLATERLSGVPLEQPERWDESAIDKLKEYQPDLILVAAYGRILPAAVIDLPGFGCVNVHASLLPRWRGASPIHNALLAGDAETGITLIRMEASVDSGPIIAASALPIDPEDTTATLSEKLAQVGADLAVAILPRWIGREIEPVAQDEARVTLCQLIEREDGRIFWNEDALTLGRRFRALTPWPGLFTFWKQGDTATRLKITDLSVQKTDPETKRPLGTVFEIGEHVGVQCGEGVLLLRTVQLEGKKPSDIRDFVSGYPEFVGSVLA